MLFFYNIGDDFSHFKHGQFKFCHLLQTRLQFVLLLNIKT